MPPQAPTRVLVVEDDAHIRLGLEEVLRSDGFAVCSCARGDQALDTLKHHHPHLVILDVMLPGMTGYDVCKQIRREKLTTPILMLTAKGQEIDKVVGLELGADDYVTKPFGVRELLARIHALLRRTQPDSQSASPPLPSEPFQVGLSTVNPRTFELSRDNLVEPLSARELKLLQIFHARQGEVLSRDHLLSEVWGYHYYGTTRTLDQVIVQLRRKLGEDPGEPRLLLTVHGVGYKLLASPTTTADAAPLSPRSRPASPPATAAVP